MILRVDYGLGNLSLIKIKLKEAKRYVKRDPQKKTQSFKGPYTVG